MNTTPTSASDSIQTLATAIFKNFDRSQDGKLDSSEFFAFISQLVGQLGRTTAAANASTALPAATQPLNRLGRELEFGGYNFDRVQNPEKSAKDAFGMLSKRVGWMPTTKEEAENWFNTYIRAGMEELGYKVHWVQGDKMQITVREGTQVIDFVGRAGGENPILQWLVVSKE